MFGLSTDRSELVLAAMRQACSDLSIEVVLTGMTDDTAEGTGLVMRVATDRAYRGRLANRVVAGLTQCLTLPVDLVERVETALHEAIINAAIHGNLELSSPAHRDLDAFADQAGRIDQLLANPEFAHRAITIALSWTWDTLEVMVADEGRGYTPRPEHTTRVGGGLFIVHAFSDRMSICDDGRCLVLRFDR